MKRFEILNLDRLNRPVRKRLQEMLKVKDAADKGGTQAKLFPFITIARREDAKAFDIAVNMFDIDSASGNGGIGFTLFR